MEWRRHGLDLLFEFYTTHKRTIPDEICKQLYIQVVTASFMNASLSLPLFGGRLRSPGINGGSWKIGLGNYAVTLRWISSFVIGHELGHYCLMSSDIDAYSPDEVTKELQREMEYWFDGFATALIFSTHDAEVFNSDTYTEFLMGGVSEENNPDVFQGRRILQLCREKFTDQPQELLRLGDTLMRAEEIQGKLDRT